jgi:hypothetical protein
MFESFAADGDLRGIFFVLAGGVRSGVGAATGKPATG